LKITVPQLLSLALCGLSNAGGDVGGFAGNPEPELAVRWYQLGAYMPFFRGHSAKGTKRREPWCYDRKHSELIKESIKDRYKLLPYWYTAFEEHCRTAVPLLRPIWFDQETIVDETNLQEQERFFVGDSLLVVPILAAGVTSIKGALDGLTGRWYDFQNKREVFTDDEIKTGLERIGTFVKGGKIIPTFEIKSYTKSTKDAKESNIHLYVAVDEEDKAEGKLYVDDGESFDYKKGAYARKSITFEKNILTWSAVEESKFELNNRVTKVVLAGVSAKFENAFLVDEEGKKKKIQMTRNATHTLLEFVTLASKNWKIVLE
jgi:alpha 1,3-glucosidase